MTTDGRGTEAAPVVLPLTQRPIPHRAIAHLSRNHHILTDYAAVSRTFKERLGADCYRQRPLVWKTPPGNSARRPQALKCARITLGREER
jgi:hypothetical protein